MSKNDNWWHQINWVKKSKVLGQLITLMSLWLPDDERHIIMQCCFKRLRVLGYSLNTESPRCQLLIHFVSIKFFEHDYVKINFVFEK